MREILFRGKHDVNGEWVIGLFVGYVETGQYAMIIDERGVLSPIVPETIGQYTGLKDKNDKEIYEGDIVQYLTCDGFDCHSIVKFGKYKQDGSSGEYKARNCLGVYVEVDNFTCPDWCDNEPEYFPDYLSQQNISEVASQCEIIDNIYENPELVKG